MKTKIATLLFLLLSSNALYAQSSSTISLPRELIWIIYFITFLMLILALILYRVSVQLKKYKKGEFESEEQKMWDKRSMWEKLFQLKPIGTDKSVEMDHEYDGIRELDNPPPPWFMFLFYGTIIFAVIYFVRFSVTGAGPTQEEEYIAEMTASEEKQEAALEELDLAIDESNVTYLEDAESISAGEGIYVANCKICHDEGGKGNSGPNLADEYWKNGGGINNVFKTIKYGVPDKGMISWEKMLNPQMIQQVSSYILSLQGTNPEGGLPPEGELWVEPVEDVEQAEDAGEEEVAEEAAEG
ncbi:MAG: c-type cytochrome [Bacteroidia bacterium]